MEQITINWAYESNRSPPSPSSGGQESETKVLTGQFVLDALSKTWCSLSWSFILQSLPSSSLGFFCVSLILSPFSCETLDSKLSCCCHLVAQPCPTLYALMDCSRPGSSVHGISQARILEWVALLGIKTESPASQCRFLTPGQPAKSWHGAFFFFFWLQWVFVAASGGYSSLWCTGFSLKWLLLWSTGARG